ncbi:hypothetical protein [Actinomycetospora chibensis]|uniref:Uncharacterized protein n=1 Tax=Actinomycetospora chibensis TaxID=663606 RepID=A0ABV9RK39_9PSEU|nr:hypothetical protein [Actinomycetospora chibensis]MDD7923048.1 hypothetical protein [Actinomycetospora chibensis]
MLFESLEFLRVSADAYDEGHEAEAKRLAVTLRVLFFDKGTSHSLLRQLGLKERLAYFDTAPDINPQNILATLGLAQTYRTLPKSPGPYFAGLDELPPPFLSRRSNFDHWWTRSVAKEQDGTEWSRENFVLTLANKEGGAHVHRNVYAPYHKLAEENGLGMAFFDEHGRELELKNNFALASVRQIAHEFMKTAKSPAYIRNS